ncbi:hypothetical protein F511_14830 [Dorcoceras hygrometricum]|uniref:Uncharacterized protein n=1 Tax=Dorcoceras hygrometricum TaxID=472368 RepID=A0A2Z7D1Y5_9LAMI|nr:hypothetical protein F511_14830 [Dorcoceras hygrometricum]
MDLAFFDETYIYIPILQVLLLLSETRRKTAAPHRWKTRKSSRVCRFKLDLASRNKIL